MGMFSYPPLQFLTPKTIRILLMMTLLLTAYNWYILKEIGTSLYNINAPWGSFHLSLPELWTNPAI